MSNFASTRRHERLARRQATDDRRKAVLAAIRLRPGIGPAGVARATGLSYNVATAHVSRLVRAGLVRQERVPGGLRCHAVARP